MTEISIEDHLKECLRLQSEDYYLSAIRHFNLHQLIRAQGVDALKNIPEDFDFYNKRGVDEFFQGVTFYFLNEFLFSEKALGNDIFKSILERTDYKVLIGAMYLKLYLYNIDIEQPDLATYNKKALTPKFQYPFDVKSDDFFWQLASDYYVISSVKNLIFEIIKHPLTKDLFENEPINFFYALDAITDLIKSAEARAFSFWFPVDGVPKALIGRAGGRGNSEKKKGRITLLAEAIKQYMRTDSPEFVTITRQQWQAALRNCNNGVLPDAKTRKTYKEEVEKDLKIQIKVVKK
ncbi:MAG: hypothetical protein WA081_19730 [Desulfosalsimonadaceae bacterium]